METHDTTEPASASASEDRPLDDVETEICTLAGHIAAATARFLTLIWSAP